MRLGTALQETMSDIALSLTLLESLQIFRDTEVLPHIIVFLFLNFVGIFLLFSCVAGNKQLLQISVGSLCVAGNEQLLQISVGSFFFFHEKWQIVLKSQAYES